MSEFCHQINFDGTELYARPDTLSYSQEPYRLKYDVLKGWGPVSISAGLLFPYYEKVEQKFETTSYHCSGASNTKFLQKNVYEEKNTITIIIIIIIIIIVIIIVVIIINFIIIIIVYRLPLVPTLFEVLWDEENTL